MLTIVSLDKDIHKSYFTDDTVHGLVSQVSILLASHRSASSHPPSPRLSASWLCYWRLSPLEHDDGIPVPLGVDRKQSVWKETDSLIEVSWLLRNVVKMAQSSNQPVLPYPRPEVFKTMTNPSSSEGGQGTRCKEYPSNIQLEEDGARTVHER